MSWALYIVIENEDTSEKRWLPIDHVDTRGQAIEDAEALAEQHETAQAGPHEWLDD